MKLYKLRHNPTGLFYTPSKGSGNLSKNGKIYIGRKPDIKYGLVCTVKICSAKKKPTGVHKIICDYFNLKWNNGYVNEYVKTNQSDWEIIELETTIKE